MRRAKPKFTAGEIYHAYNRGVEKRGIFTETSDYFRMIRNLYELNDKNAAFNPQHPPKRGPTTAGGKQPREILVEILAFTLMPNHFHLILREIEDGGIVKFMHKLGIGYAMYFNKKNNRVGPLFQGRFMATHVDTNDYLRNVIGYVHTNPVTLAENYRDPISVVAIVDFLEKYRWSSFPDYVGIANFPMVTTRDFVLGAMGGTEGIRASAETWITRREEKLASIPEIAETTQIRSR